MVETLVYCPLSTIPHRYLSVIIIICLILLIHSRYLYVQLNEPKYKDFFGDQINNLRSARKVLCYDE